MRYEPVMSGTKLAVAVAAPVRTAALPTGRLSVHRCVRAAFAASVSVKVTVSPMTRLLRPRPVTMPEVLPEERMIGAAMVIAYGVLNAMDPGGRGTGAGGGPVGLPRLTVVCRPAAAGRMLICSFAAKY